MVTTATINDDIWRDVKTGEMGLIMQQLFR